eukprot:5474225-Heterocapsa_arctica.AAC.1
MPLPSAVCRATIVCSRLSYTNASTGLLGNKNDPSVFGAVVRRVACLRVSAEGEYLQRNRQAALCVQWQYQGWVPHTCIQGVP